MSQAEPQMTRLLENARIILWRKNRMPPPPPVCEEWRRQAENFVRRRHKDQPRFGLGYHNTDASDDDDEHFNINQVYCLTLIATAGEVDGCLHYVKG